MSVQCMSQVWRIDLPQSQAWLLMALADHANPEGGDVYPSIAKLAAMTGMATRTVQLNLRALEERGLAVKVAEAHYHHPAEYRLDFTNATYHEVPPEPGMVRGAKSAPLNDATGVQPDANRGATGCEQGCNLMQTGVQPDARIRRTLVKEPEENRKKNRKTRAHAREATPMPEDMVLTDERATVAIKHGCKNPEKAWTAFVSWHESKGNVFKNWDAAWRTWCNNHDKYGCPCRGSPAGRNGSKPSVRDMAREIAAKWAAEEGKTG